MSHGVLLLLIVPPPHPTILSPKHMNTCPRSRAGCQRNLDSLTSEKELIKQMGVTSATAAALLARKALVILMLASKGRLGTWVQVVGHGLQCLRHDATSCALQAHAGPGV